MKLFQPRIARQLNKYKNKGVFFSYANQSTSLLPAPVTKLTPFLMKPGADVLLNRHGVQEIKSHPLEKKEEALKDGQEASSSSPEDIKD